MSDDGEVPVHDGPDPKDWPEVAPRIWGAVLNIEALGRTIDAIGSVTPAESERVLGEVRDFLHHARQDQRVELAEMILHAYKVVLPEEDAEPTEAVGGIRGDSDRPGNRDHV